MQNSYCRHTCFLPTSTWWWPGWYIDVRLWVVMPCQVHFIAKRPLHYTLTFLSQKLLQFRAKYFPILGWILMKSRKCVVVLSPLQSKMCCIIVYLFVLTFFLLYFYCIVIVVSPRGGSVVLPGPPPEQPLFTPPPTSPTPTRYPSRSVSPPSPAMLLPMSILSVFCSQDSRGDRSWSWGRWCHDKTPLQPWLYFFKK